MTVLYLDIETLAEGATVGMPPGIAPGYDAPEATTFFKTPESRTVPSSYKKPETIARWESAESVRFVEAGRLAMEEAFIAADKHRADAWQAWAKGSLSPMRGRVACIAVAADDSDVAVIECAEDEANGLYELGAYIGATGPDTIVAHNGHGFDYEFLYKRAMKHRLPLLAKQMRQPKPWDARLQDTMLMWNNGQRHKHTSLDALCNFLDIERAPSTIDGAGVLDAYIEGRWHEVVEHGASDVEDLRRVYKRLREAM